MRDSGTLLTIADVLAVHDTSGYFVSGSGEVCVRDSYQSLWFYYRLEDGEYRTQRTTRNHPRFDTQENFVYTQQ